MTCLKKVGCTPDYAGMEKALRIGRAGVLRDNGVVGELLYGEDAVAYWKSQNTSTTGCFAVNPATSRFMLGTVKK